MRLRGKAAAVICAAFAVLVLSSCGEGLDHGLVASRHADFTHDTLALTWQPGFCGQGRCLPDQPHAPLIGLHGLWASETQDLIARGVTVQTWWARGCDAFAADPPTRATDHEEAGAGLAALTPSTAARLAVATAHMSHSLPAHEWTKHGACFGYTPERFFGTALDLRDRFAATTTARMLAAQAGRLMDRETLLAAFARETGARAPRALQLRCGRDRAGRVVLEQLWFTLKPGALGAFPAGSAYTASPEAQDDCPATFLVPDWAQEAEAGLP